MNLGIACTLGLEAAVCTQGFCLEREPREVRVAQAFAKKRLESRARTCV